MKASLLGLLFCRILLVYNETVSILVGRVSVLDVTSDKVFERHE